MNVVSSVKNSGGSVMVCDFTKIDGITNTQLSDFDPL